MRRHVPSKLMVLVSAVIGVSFALAGCSTDENPVSPQKMEEIRKKEADERANFKPGGTDTAPGTQ